MAEGTLTFVILTSIVTYVGMVGFMYKMVCAWNPLGFWDDAVDRYTVYSISAAFWPAIPLLAIFYITYKAGAFVGIKLTSPRKSKIPRAKVIKNA